MKTHHAGRTTHAAVDRPLRGLVGTPPSEGMPPSRQMPGGSTLEVIPRRCSWREVVAEPGGELACRAGAEPYLLVYVYGMADHISIRDLQKMWSESNGALPGPTPVKSGDRTVGLLVPLRSADPERLAQILEKAEALARGRDAATDDAALAQFGDVDPVDWSLEAVRTLLWG